MITSQKKNILLTGGTGFIGRNIVEQLSSKYGIFAPSLEELDLLDESVVERFFKSQRFDVVIHAANIGEYKASEEPNGISVKNIRMFFSLVRQLKPHQKMIFLGSGAEYNKRRDIASIKEDEFDKCIPIDNYGFAKYVCSKYIEKTNNIVNLRCFGVYGKYEQHTRFISNAIISALNNKSIVIRKNTYFDYLYVDDLVKIIDFFISNKNKHKFYNAASGISIDLITLSSLVKKIIGHKEEIIVEESGMGKEYTANTSRLNQETSIQLTSLEEGIGKLAEYYRNQH